MALHCYAGQVCLRSPANLMRAGITSCREPELLSGPLSFPRRVWLAVVLASALMGRFRKLLVVNTAECRFIVIVVAGGAAAKGDGYKYIFCVRPFFAFFACFAIDTYPRVLQRVVVGPGAGRTALTRSWQLRRGRDCGFC